MRTERANELVNRDEHNCQKGVVKMYGIWTIGGFLLIGLLMGWCGVGFAAEPKVVVMMGGKFCDAYHGDVETALKKNPGV
jgi:hypothetical protein